MYINKGVRGIYLNNLYTEIYSDISLRFTLSRHKKGGKRQQRESQAAKHHWQTQVNNGKPQQVH